MKKTYLMCEVCVLHTYTQGGQSARSRHACVTSPDWMKWYFWLCVMVQSFLWRCKGGPRDKEERYNVMWPLVSFAGLLHNGNDFNSWLMLLGAGGLRAEMSPKLNSLQSWLLAFYKPNRRQLKHRSFIILSNQSDFEYWSTGKDRLCWWWWCFSYNVVMKLFPIWQSSEWM